MKRSASSSDPRIHDSGHYGNNWTWLFAVLLRQIHLGSDWRRLNYLFHRRTVCKNQYYANDTNLISCMRTDSYRSLSKSSACHIRSQQKKRRRAGYGALGRRVGESRLISRGKSQTAITILKKEHICTFRKVAYDVQWCRSSFSGSSDTI